MSTMASVSCKQCGCSDIDTDPARGDAVCTNCGCVLEQSIIVSEVTFEEDGHGGASAIGQFVSAETRGGGTVAGVGGGAGFHTPVSKESREITLRNAKKRIADVSQQLRLNQHCIDVAFNFFKMALSKQLTKGRKNSLTIAACIYMTCRIEGTPHLLIDFSDVLQVDVYALGRAYVQISRALCINIPAMDPCMYILRFAHKFDLQDKTHDVAMTALRLVQRMKRDWIHLGRRPSGLCGAALLISARLHDFSRSVQDIIRVVKVHETTLRKRLVEFGETPSSSLTLDEFMSVDLEEEHDPPSYKAARIKDRERLQKLLDSNVCSEEFKDLQSKIEDELEKRRRKILCKSGASSPAPSLSSRPGSSCAGENEVETQFIMESTISTINSIISEKAEEGKREDADRKLMPPPPAAVIEAKTELKNKLQLESTTPAPEELALVEANKNLSDGELDLQGIDDDEINGYLMSDVEVQRKTTLWLALNKEYLEAQRVKQEQLEKDIREGKVEKKKKKMLKPKATFQAKTPNEAIKIMLKERRISSKINYEVLNSLSGVAAVGISNTPDDPSASTSQSVTVIESGPIIPPHFKRKVEKDEPQLPTAKKVKASHPVKQEASSSISSKDKKAKIDDVKLDVEDKKDIKAKIEEMKTTLVEPDEVADVEDEEDDDEDEEETQEDESSLSASHLLRQFRGGDDNEEDDYYD